MEQRVSWGAATPLKPKTGNSSDPQFWGLMYLYHTSFNAQQPIRRDNTIARGLLLGGQPQRPSQGGVALADLNFEGSPLLCVHGLTKFGVLTHGEGVFLLGQPCHRICTDAWFVSDS